MASEAAEATKESSAKRKESSKGSGSATGAAAEESTATEQAQSQANGQMSSSSNGNSAHQHRKRKFTNEERKDHSVIEKKRREELNNRLLTLARNLPTISQVKRLSKGLIVQGAIDHIFASRQTILESLPEIRALFAERDELLHELNDWRTTAGLPLKTARIASDHEKIEGLYAVEKTTCNSFPKGFTGENTTPGSGNNRELDRVDEEGDDYEEDAYEDSGMWLSGGPVPPAASSSGDANGSRHKRKKSMPTPRTGTGTGTAKSQSTALPSGLSPPAPSIVPNHTSNGLASANLLSAISNLSSSSSSSSSGSFQQQSPSSQILNIIAENKRPAHIKNKQAAAAAAAAAALQAAQMQNTSSALATQAGLSLLQSPHLETPQQSGGPLDPFGDLAQFFEQTATPSPSASSLSSSTTAGKSATMTSSGGLNASPNNNSLHMHLHAPPASNGAHATASQAHASLTFEKMPGQTSATSGDAGVNGRSDSLGIADDSLFSTNFMELYQMVRRNKSEREGADGHMGSVPLSQIGLPAMDGETPKEGTATGGPALTQGGKETDVPVEDNGLGLVQQEFASIPGLDQLFNRHQQDETVGELELQSALALAAQLQAALQQQQAQGVPQAQGSEQDHAVPSQLDFLSHPSPMTSFLQGYPSSSDLLLSTNSISHDPHHQFPASSSNLDFLSHWPRQHHPLQ